MVTVDNKNKQIIFTDNFSIGDMAIILNKFFPEEEWEDYKVVINGEE